MRLLVPGGHGQLGRALARRGAVLGFTVIAPSRASLELGDAAAIARAIAAAEPAVVINAAAYTAVDRAETERDAAFAANSTGPAHLADACAARDLPLLHVSTDYVFDGAAHAPYREDDATAPLGVYGASKLAGELAVLARHPRATVVRTARVFSADGANFVRAMLRLATTRAELRVVDDQLGNPTWADDLAAVLLVLASRVDRGVVLARRYHAAGAGPISWHGFARAIVELARTHRPLACEAVVPIHAADFRTPARRPAYAVLDTSRLVGEGIAVPAWTGGLAQVVATLLAPGAAPL